MRVAIDKLTVSTSNPRKTKANGLSHEAMVASLKAHGQIVPLLVKELAGKPGYYDVIAGSRRLAAAKEAKLPDLEVTLYTGQHAAGEVGAVENMLREPMHPLDEAEQIARLIADGEQPQDVAARFGQTKRWAEQRVMLNELSDRAKKAFRAGMFGLSAAQALTLGTKAAQDSYLKKAREAWRLRPETIRAHFVGEGVSAKEALFDLKAYPLAAIVTDLFENQVTLTDRETFDRLQRLAIAARAEDLKAKGWSDVIVVDDSHYSAMSDYVRADKAIKERDRSKYVVLIDYRPSNGHVEILEGWAKRKDASKVAKGATPGDDKVAAEDVKPRNCFELSASQTQMLGALLTEAIATAIRGGDTWLALKTLCTPLIKGDGRRQPAWCGLRPSHPNFVGVNTMFDQKIEHPIEPRHAEFPTRKQFEKMAWDEVMPLVRLAALRSLELMPGPDAEAMALLAETRRPWFRYDAGFLNRYRLDGLQNLAKRLRIPFEGLKKSELMKAILASKDASKFIPLRSA